MRSAKSWMEDFPLESLTSLESIKDSVDNNNSSAISDTQFRLGRTILETSADESKQAVDLIQYAASNEHTKAQVFLGLMYFHGTGVSQNFIEATRWLNKVITTNDHSTEASKEFLDKAIKTLEEIYKQEPSLKNLIGSAPSATIEEWGSSSDWIKPVISPGIVPPPPRNPDWLNPSEDKKEENLTASSTIAETQSSVSPAKVKDTSVIAPTDSVMADKTAEATSQYGAYGPPSFSPVSIVEDKKNEVNNYGAYGPIKWTSVISPSEFNMEHMISIVSQINANTSGAPEKITSQGELIIHKYDERLLYLFTELNKLDHPPEINLDLKYSYLNDAKNGEQAVVMYQALAKSVNQLNNLSRNKDQTNAKLSDLKSEILRVRTELILSILEKPELKAKNDVQINELNKILISMGDKFDIEAVTKHQKAFDLYKQKHAKPEISVAPTTHQAEEKQEGSSIMSTISALAPSSVFARFNIFSARSKTEAEPPTKQKSESPTPDISDDYDEISPDEAPSANPTGERNQRK